MIKGIWAFALLLAAMLLPMAANAQAGPNLLKNVQVAGTTKTGEEFTGKVTITRMEAVIDGNARMLRVEGVLDGTGKFAKVKNQRFTSYASLGSVPAAGSQVDALAANAAVAQQATQTCDILFLDLGPIFLDVLGLTVDLSQIVLDINAVAGQGNLLGNLLCALVGLFDGGGLLSEITRLIQNINNILA